MKCDNIKRALNGNLTKILELVIAKTEKIRDRAHYVVDSIEDNKEQFIEQIISNLEFTKPSQAESIEESDTFFIREEIEEEIDRVIFCIEKSCLYLEKFKSVIKNSTDISKQLEKTLFETLRDVVRDTKWYRKYFPVEYEKRRREKEYERYNIDPDLWHKRKQFLEQIPFEESFKREVEKARSKQSHSDKGIANVRNFITLRGQFNVLKFNVQKEIEYLEDISNNIKDMCEQFFSMNSPIVGQGSVILEKLKSAEKSEKNKTSKDAIQQKIQIIENLFGTEERPGRLIDSGRRAFLFPALNLIQEAISIIKSMKSRTYKEVSEDIKKYLEIQRQESDEEEKTLPSSQQARKNIVLERLGLKTRQQKRCKLVQRIASS